MSSVGESITAIGSLLREMGSLTEKAALLRSKRKLQFCMRRCHGIITTKKGRKLASSWSQYACMQETFFNADSAVLALLHPVFWLLFWKKTFLFRQIFFQKNIIIYYIEKVMYSYKTLLEGPHFVFYDIFRNLKIINRQPSYSPDLAATGLLVFRS